MAVRSRRQRFPFLYKFWTKGCIIPSEDTPVLQKIVYDVRMGRTNIVLDDELVRKARKLTRLKTKREIVDRALELLVRSESRKGIVRYYGKGIWKGDLKAMRRNRG